MSTLDQRSLSWMRAHHATIPVSELAHESTFDERRAMVSAGLLERVVDGAYGFGGIAADELARCAALCGSRPHLVVAGPTAGRLWELRRSPRDGLVHVIAPPASNPCREQWVRAYRTALVFDDEVVRRSDGIRLTSPPRTVVDLTRYIDSWSLASMIEHALSRRLCTVGTLHRTALRLATPGSAMGQAIPSRARAARPRCAGRITRGAARVRSPALPGREWAAAPGASRAALVRRCVLRRRRPSAAVGRRSGPPPGAPHHRGSSQRQRT